MRPPRRFPRALPGAVVNRPLWGHWGQPSGCGVFLEGVRPSRDRECQVRGRVAPAEPSTLPLSARHHKSTSLRLEETGYRATVLSLSHLCPAMSSSEEPKITPAREESCSAGLCPASFPVPRRPRLRPSGDRGGWAVCSPALPGGPNQPELASHGGSTRPLRTKKGRGPARRRIAFRMPGPHADAFTSLASRPASSPRTNTPGEPPDGCRRTPFDQPRGHA